MCGVIGVHLVNPTHNDVEVVKKVFKNLQIRGRHASGVSYFDCDGIKTFKEPVPVSELLEQIDLHDLVFQDELLMIGHARYSTSDLLHNQPIHDGGDIAIAHNGVITQSDPSTWHEQFGLEAMNSNDSSLVLACCKSGKHPLKEFYNSSMAVTELDARNHTLVAYRNGQRPLWYGELNSGVIFASSKDSLARAGIEEDYISCCTNSVEYQSVVTSSLVSLETKYPVCLGQRMQIDVQSKPEVIKDFKG